jgi:molybdenum cofactor biosynthesis enzyme MoaA
MTNIFYRLLQLNRIVKSHRIKFAFLLFADFFNLRYLCLRFDPILSCNLRCQMCYFSIKDWREKNKGSFNHEEIEHIAGIFFKKTYQLYIGCGAEPTLYKDFMDLVILGKKNKIPFVGLVTNGQLLSEEHIKKFIFYGLDEISISTHGVRKETYEKLMVNASFDKLTNVLSLIDRLKYENSSKLPVVRLNYTVNPDNLDELEEFFENYGKYNIGVLQIRPIYDLGDTAYKNKNLLSLINKYNKIIEILHETCKMRKIIFMANRLDPSYQSVNYSAVIVNYVRRYISPQYVWENDFNWRNESYRDYSTRIKWRTTLFKNIFLCIDKIATPTAFLSYEID